MNDNERSMQQFSSGATRGIAKRLKRRLCPQRSFASAAFSTASAAPHLSGFQLIFIRDDRLPQEHHDRCHALRNHRQCGADQQRRQVFIEIGVVEVGTDQNGFCRRRGASQSPGKKLGCVGTYPIRMHRCRASAPINPIIISMMPLSPTSLHASANPASRQPAIAAAVQSAAVARFCGRLCTRRTWDCNRKDADLEVHRGQSLARELLGKNWSRRL